MEFTYSILHTYTCMYIQYMDSSYHHKPNLALFDLCANEGISNTLRNMTPLRLNIFCGIDKNGC